MQPAAGDAGGALGAALTAWYGYLGNERTANEDSDSQNGSYLGPEYSNEQIISFVEGENYKAQKLDDDNLTKRVSELIANEKIIGWFQGRMEFGPRALGNRSIIGDARSSKMQSTMNLKIKFRESFRPFAPSVLREKVSEYFDADIDSPYMLLVASVKE